MASSTTDGAIAGRRLLAGLNTTLLSSLKGGQGFGTLGALNLTDRSGSSAVVNLSAAETVDDVLSAINASGLDLKAELNDARNGLRLIDTTDATTSNLIIANGDVTNTATKLGLNVNAAVTEHSSGDLSRQIVSRQTLLASYNHGAGVTPGSIQITDSAGASSGLNLNTLAATTIGDVLDAINNLSIGVEARINDTGDGILLTDTAAGAGKLTVQDVGNGKSALELKIAGQAATTTIDGSTTIKIALVAGDTLSDLVAGLNTANAGITASIFNDGSATPYHLSLLNSKSGKSDAYVIDGSGLSLKLSEVTAAQDALVAVGQGGGAGSLLVSSSSNVVDNGVPGVRVTLAGTSTDPVTVTVKQDVAAISSKVKSIVDQYNKLQEKLAKYDSYNVDTDERGTLFGSTEARRIKTDLARLLTGRFNSSVKSLATVGVSLDETGKLQYNEAKFTATYADDPEGVELLFTDSTTGFVARLDGVVDALSAVDNSVLINRTKALQSRAEDLSARIFSLNARLAKEKERMLKQFYSLETAVSKIQNAFNSISSSLAGAVSLAQSINNKN